MTDTTMRIMLTATDGASPVIKGVMQSLSGAGGLLGLIGAGGESGGLIGLAAGADVAIGALAITMGVQAVQAAGNLQTGLTSLVTGAGETQSALGQVSDGILQMSVQTGTSTDQLISGMYMIESAGFHAANGGLDVLRAAAEGAQVGSADLGTVANAVTSALNAYGMKGAQAAMITNQLIATVAAGKMHMQDLANSLAAVLPIAAAAHISYAQVGGAIATMTMQGMSAQQATQNLANAIRSLQNPNSVAVAEMQQLGLNSNQVAMSLGKKGLTGTLDEITQAILAHMGPAGTVLLSTFNNSKTAAADANAMIKAMPPNLQKLADAYMNGSVTAKQWRSDLQALPPIQANLMKQFATTADKTHAFNTMLASGAPAAQTYNAALSKVMGGATGLNVALMLTGTHMATFKNNVASIDGAAKAGGNSITGFALVQQTMNFKLAQANAAWNVFLIKMGQQLLPVVTQVAGALVPLIQGLTNVAMWILHNWAIMTALKALLIVVGAVIVGVVVAGLALLIAQLLVLALVLAVPVGIILGIIWVFQHWGQIAHWLQGVWGAFIAWLQSVFSALGGWFAGIWARVATGATDAWNWLVHGVQNIVSGAVSWLTQTWQNAVATVVGWFLWLYNHNYYFQHLVDAIRTIITTVVNWLRTTWATVTGWIVAKWTWLKDMATIYFMALYVTIQTRIQQAENFLHSIWSSIMSWLQGTWATITGDVSSAWGKISSIFSSAWNTYVAPPLNSLKNSLLGFFSNLASLAVTWGRNLISGFINGIKAMAGAVGGTVQGIMSHIAGFMGFHSPSKEGPGRELDVWGPNLMKGYAEGILSQLPMLQHTLNLVMSPVSRTLSTIPTGSSSVAPSGLASSGGSAQGGGVTVIIQSISVNDFGPNMPQTVINQLTQQISQKLAQNMRGQRGGIIIGNG